MYTLLPKRMTFLLVLTFIATTPVSVHAAVNAGVVNGVWFSKNNPQEGEVVRIFTAVQNQSPETVNGSVAFLVNDDIIGTKKFSVQSNDIIPVSIEYTFTGGENEVSAYITSVEDEAVAYTIAPQTSVQVSLNDSAQTKSVLSTTEIAPLADDAVNTITNVTKKVTDTVDPISEKTAIRIEEFRDNLLSTKTEQEETTKPTSPKTKTETAKAFLQTSKDITSTPELSVWEKTLGVLLSFLALLVRFWFIFVILIVAFISWRLVRGQRIN